MSELRGHYKGGRTDLISVRVTPALNRAMNLVAEQNDQLRGKTKSDLINRAVRRLIAEEYPDIAASFPEEFQ